MAKKIVSASIVRAWANENMALIPAAGLPSITGSNGKAPRGRLHPEVIAVFNKNNKSAKYGEGAPKESTLIKVQVMATADSGRKYPRLVTLTAEEVRELTGHASRGRIPTAVKHEAALAKVS